MDAATENKAMLESMRKTMEASTEQQIRFLNTAKGTIRNSSGKGKGEPEVLDPWAASLKAGASVGPTRPAAADSGLFANPFGDGDHSGHQGLSGPGSVTSLRGGTLGRASGKGGLATLKLVVPPPGGNL